MRERVFIREVGLRDGLQLVKTVLGAEKKLAWLHAEARTGIAEFEVTSFVPARVLPQFADAAMIAEQALKLDTKISALAVNLKGAIAAFETGIRKLNYVVSASEAHSLANVRRSTEAALDEFRKIVAEREMRGLHDKVELSCAVATAFGCSIQGEVPERQVLHVTEQMIANGADEILVADTVGYGNPMQVRRLLASLKQRFPDMRFAAHFHDTRGLGLANVTAAIDAGIRHFDASLGGLGGCPFAPGASGNIDTEDCVFLLESMGFDTGVDLHALLLVREQLAQWLPGERLSGSVHAAGLPKTHG